jgi:hypothetical protein
VSELNHQFFLKILLTSIIKLNFFSEDHVATTMSYSDSSKINTISNSFKINSNQKTTNPESIQNKVTTISQYNKGLSNCKINSNYSLTPGLINYWSFSGNLNDSIGDSHLFGGMNYNLTLDRFNSSYSALSLRNGYLDMPSGVYFNSSLSVLAWVNVRNYPNWARIIECGNGPNKQNVQFVYTKSTTGLPALVIYKPDGSHLIITSIVQLDLNKWQHVAFVLDYPNAYIYINGVRTAFSKSLILPENSIRTQCYIGKSNFVADKLANGDFDEIKIFNRSLTDKEVQFEMNNDFCI